MCVITMQFVGVQVDVTSKTEGTAVGDRAGVPLLVKYDTRIREQGKNAVNEINETVQVHLQPGAAMAVLLHHIMHTILNTYRWQHYR
jgi:phototropin